MKRTDPLPSRWKAPAPAVGEACRILGFLGHGRSEAGVTEIARALGINKSTCFNILATLVRHQFLVKESRYPAYRLGPKLVDLGTASRRNFSPRSLLQKHLRGVVDEVGLTCLVGQVMAANAGIVVIDRLLPHHRRPDAVTAPIGHVYPLTAPAMGRAVLARMDEEEALEAVRMLGGLAGTPEPEWRRQLGESRTQGFAVSCGEYEVGVNAVATVVSAPGEDFAAILCLIGSTAHLPTQALPEIGGKLSEVARRLEGEWQTGPVIMGGL